MTSHKQNMIVGELDHNHDGEVMKPAAMMDIKRHVYGKYALQASKQSLPNDLV